MDLFIGTAIMISGLLKRMGQRKYEVLVEDEGVLLRKRIKSIKKEQEVNETEMKLRRRQLELHEKRMEIIAASNIRKLQCLTNKLDGLEPPEFDNEVEKNEYYMYSEIIDELRELNDELKMHL